MPFLFVFLGCRSDQSSLCLLIIIVCSNICIYTTVLIADLCKCSHRCFTSPDSLLVCPKSGAYISVVVISFCMHHSIRIIAFSTYLSVGFQFWFISYFVMTGPFVAYYTYEVCSLLMSVRWPMKREGEGPKGDSNSQVEEKIDKLTKTQTTVITKRTKDWATQIQLKIRGDIRCAGRLNISFEIHRLAHDENKLFCSQVCRLVFILIVIKPHLDSIISTHFVVISF